MSDRGLGKIKKWDWRAMGVALVLASFLWFSNTLNGSDYIAEIDLPIEIVPSDTKVVAFIPPPESVRLQVEGNGWDLLKTKMGMDLQPLQISLDQPLSTKAIAFANIRASVIDRLPAMRVLNALEDSLRFDFDTLVSRVLPLEIDSLRLPLAENYRTTTPIRLSSDSIRVTLPTSLASGLPDTVWLDVDERDVEDNFSTWLTIKENTTPVLREPLVTIEPEQVHLRFGVDLFLLQTYMLPVQTVNFPNDSSAVLLDTLVQMTCWVRRSNELITPPDSLHITADFKDLNYSDTSILYTFPELSSIYVEPSFRPVFLQVKIADSEEE